VDDYRDTPRTTPAAPLWPLPAGPPVTRAFRYAALALVVALEAVAGAPIALLQRFPRPLPRRLRDLEKGHSISIEASVIGSSGWCPRFPDVFEVRVTRESAISTLGRDREIPLDRLAPVTLHRPGQRPDAPRLPGDFWILDLDGEGGAGSIAARLDDLALLAAVAGWPPPPNWPSRQ
jgi:hypothetical protein